MSEAQARAEAARLKAFMLKHGVKCSIELQVGRPWAGDDWYTRKHALMNHHTAGPKTGKTPSLSVVKRGRRDLPGALCNGYGGRDFIYRIITMGLANHSGLGGPLVVGGFRIPKDSARISTWGTEWEHDGRSPWPADMQEFMGRANAALVEYHRIPIVRSIEHSTWTDRKIDRNRYAESGSTGQNEIRRFGDLIIEKPPVVKVPVKTPPKIPAPIKIDGEWGPKTWRHTQLMLRVPVTSKQNASTMRAFQRYLGMKGSAVSGQFSRDTIRHIQRMVKVKVDGDLGPVTIRAWQRHLNRAVSRQF